MARYLNLSTGKFTRDVCEDCFDGLLETYQQKGGKYKDMSDRTVKIPEELYYKVKAKADKEGTNMATALGDIAEGLPGDIEEFIPGCAVELGVRMPRDYRWIVPLTEVLPPGLRGKLEPYAKVIDCAAAKAELRQAAENHLDEIEEVPGTEAETEG